MTRLVRLVQRFEDILLAAVLAVMVALAALQIVLRNVFDGGLVWADPLLRILVLWITLLGAITASRGNNNISISALLKILPPGLKPLAGVLTGAFTALVCGLLAWHGGRFVVMDYQDGIFAYGNVPAWIAELIIPLSFTLIGLRYMVMAYLDLMKFLGRGGREE